MPETDTFDADAFCDWLDEQDGRLTVERVDERWPNYPWDDVGVVTMALIDGDVVYYEEDLRRAARGLDPVD